MAFLQPPRVVSIGAALLGVVACFASVAVSTQRGGAFAPQASVAPPAEGWRTHGGNLHDQRYSPLTTIDRSNVALPKGVWRTHLNGSP